MYLNISEFVSNENEIILNESGSCSLENLKDASISGGRADFDLLISKVDRELNISIDIDYEYVKACDRCLIDVENFDTIKYSAKLMNENSELNIEDEDDDVVFMDHNKIDISKLVNELVILSIPMKNLCEEDCKGICPKCGKDLNKGDCDCNTENINLKFSVLKDFKIDEEV